MPEIRIAPDGATLEVVSAGESPFAIHPLWLRERCADLASLDQQTEQRLYNPSELYPEARILHIETTGLEEFEVTFSDGSQSRFTGAAILAELPGQLADVPKQEPWSSTSPTPKRMGIYDGVAAFLVAAKQRLKENNATIIRERMHSSVIMFPTPRNVPIREDDFLRF